MNNLRIGTCSWVNKSILSSGWYPPDIRSRDDRLSYYASRFNTVEVDSTFYSIPDIVDVYRWAVHTPPDFIFNIKAYGLFTFHSVLSASLPRWVRDELKSKSGEERVNFQAVPKAIRLELWRQFSESIMPLHKIGKLGYVLFQIPPWASYSDRMIRYIDRVIEETRPFKVAFEVRNSSWMSQENRGVFLDRLRSHNIAYVVVDEPQLDWTVPSEAISTASWGSVIRFHGRNKEAWENGKVSVGEKFRYLYSKKELERWRGQVLSLREKSDRVYVMFNNCWRDYGVRNAVTMQGILGVTLSGSVQKELDLS